MCQLCDEANAYLAQLEAASKKPARDEASKDGSQGHIDPLIPESDDGFERKKIAPKAQVY